MVWKKSVMEIYPPTWSVKYDQLESEVRFCGPDEHVKNSENLYERDRAFFRALVEDKGFRQCLLQGQEGDQTSEKGRQVEATLINRAKFASFQVSRAEKSEPYIFDKEEKIRVAHDVFQKLLQSMNLLEDWGTDSATEFMTTVSAT